MPIIYTYPTVIPASNDLILLTDESDSEKATKTATVSSLLSVGLAQDINTTKVAVSAAEIAALWTTPKTLVAAPGASKAIFLMNWAIKYNYVAPIYTTNNTGWVAIHYSTLSTFDLGYALSPNMATGGGVGDGFSATASFFQQIIRPSGLASWYQGGATANIVANDAIQLSTIGGNAGSLTGGGSDLVIYLTYKIIDL